MSRFTNMVEGAPENRHKLDRTKRGLPLTLLGTCLIFMLQVSGKVASPAVAMPRFFLKSVTDDLLKAG